MKINLLSLFTFLHLALSAQTNIADFVSIEPNVQTTDFIFPKSHNFQKIIEENDPLTAGGVLPDKTDFTGYVPIDGSSENGYLSINSEQSAGGVSILDINFNTDTKLWETTYSQAVDFKSVYTTAGNCSGAVTPWGTIISSEELNSYTDLSGDGYSDIGWNVEIDPKTKTVINKLWALGNFNHENITIHSNLRTVYQGSDSNPGYLYKFVADEAKNLTSGSLFVYKGSKNGSGEWIRLNNTTKSERNYTLDQSDLIEATIFNGIEDVEVRPDGYVYFAVKGESIYRFKDSDPISGTTVTEMISYVGDKSYDISYKDGVKPVMWGYGSDNLAFDGEGNLWALQDGGDNYIWVVGADHTAEKPNVRIFGSVPKGSEPTGITFTPDFKFLFMSIQHPDTLNKVTTQIDAAGNIISFGKDISIAIALKDLIGDPKLSGLNDDLNDKIILYPNPTKDLLTIELGKSYSKIEMTLSTENGKVIDSKNFKNVDQVKLDLTKESNGVYFIHLKSKNEDIKTFKAIKN